MIGLTAGPSAPLPPWPQEDLSFMKTKQKARSGNECLIEPFPTRSVRGATITQDEWMKALEEAQQSQTDKVPEAWKTVEDLSKIWGLESTQTRRQIHILETMGRLEKKKFRISTEGRGVYPTLHYRLK